MNYTRISHQERYAIGGITEPSAPIATSIVTWSFVDPTVEYTDFTSTGASALPVLAHRANPVLPRSVILEWLSSRGRVDFYCKQKQTERYVQLVFKYGQKIELCPSSAGIRYWPHKLYILFQHPKSYACIRYKSLVDCLCCTISLIPR